jgi:MFS family permease
VGRLNHSLQSPAADRLHRDFGLVDADEGTKNAFSANVVSLLQAGCFFGALAAGPGADKFGRRIVLIASGAIFIVGSAMQTWSAGSKGLLFAGRAVGGLVSRAMCYTLEFC